MNWLSIAVIVFFMIMIAIGVKKGLVRMVMAFASSLLAIAIVAAIHEPIEAEVRSRTACYERIEEGVGTYVQDGFATVLDNISQSADDLIERLPFPDVLKTYLRDGDNPANWKRLGVMDAADYVTRCLSELVFSALVCVCVFVVVRIAIWILTALLEHIVELPVLRQLNSIAGAAAGAACTVILLWVGGLIVTAAAATDWGREALVLIRESPLLSLIYNNNLLISGMLSNR